MRPLIATSIVSVIFAVGAVVACGSAEVHTETATPPPPASSSAAPEPPPPPVEPVVVRNVQMDGTRVRVPHELEFGSDKATIDDTKDPNKEILGTLLEFMTKNTHVTKLRIEGHTDNKGTPAHNQDLSQQRADAVAKWLVGHGIDAGRMKTIGHGDTKPEVPNDSDAHRQQNRRTEFHVEEIDGKPHVPLRHRSDATAAGSSSAAPSATPATSGSAAPAKK